jgi:hypothetical protein
MTLPDDRINPYKHTPVSEFPHTPDPSVKYWTEHYFFFGYDRDNQLGMCVHIGRLPDEPTIWRAVLQIYLPGGEELLVAKYHGRDGHARGPGAGPLKITCVEPFRLWTVEFDGAAFSTTRQEITREVLRDGVAEPVKFFMVMEAACPLFGRDEDLLEGRSSSTFHSEQIMRMRGSMKYRGRDVTLNGMGTRDHSSGHRDYGPVVADIWFQGLFDDGYAVQTQVVRFEKAEYKTAFIYHPDTHEHEMCELIEHPHVNTLASAPKSLAADPLSEAARNTRIVMKSRRGLEVIEIELMHAHAITYLHPVEELIGTALYRPDGVQMCECPSRIRWNGKVGTACRERVGRTGTLFACS